MQKKYTPLFFSLLTLFTIQLNAQLNIDLLGHLEYADQLSNLCGYADGAGNEYAIVGTEDGTSIVDVTDPTTPVEVQFVDGINSIWREVRVWDHYAYVVTEGGGGLLCIDLSGLPGSVTTNFTDCGVGLNSGHTVHADENGFIHIFGSNKGGGGDEIFNANLDPMNPPFAGEVTDWYIHDGFVRGDTLWAGNIYEGQFSVWDLSDKTSPVLLAVQTTPYTFTHNTWLSDDAKYLFTTDEVSNATVAAYDVSDLTDIKELDQFRANPGTNSIPHNTMVLGNFLVTAYYRDGVIITDATHPDNLIKTGWYDTSPLAGDGFNGCWGSWPFLPSGNIIAGDMEEGLFVLGPTYIQACYLEGTVTDASTGSPIFDVAVDITAIPGVETTTDVIGEYTTGYYEAATYDITFSKPGFYIPQTITGVTLTNGNTVVLDVEMEPLPTIAITGKIIDAATGTGVANADVLFENALYSFISVCDADGNFAFPSVYDDTYSLYAGKWGYITNKADLDIEPGGIYSMTLQRGYYDDFIFQNDWTESGTAESGIWERAIPEGTYSGADISNADEDVDDDYGTYAFVTGNDITGGAGGDDVDNGTTILTSPEFDLTTYIDPQISYQRWFFNGGGASTPNDSLKVFISNGIEKVFVDEIDNSSDDESLWMPVTIDVNNYIDLTENMTIEIYTADQNATGHLLECGLDHFMVTDQITSAPDAIFSSDITSGCAPLTVHFEDLSIGATSWNWVFDGGTPGTSELQNPTVVYSLPGTYDVMLTAINDLGEDESTSTSYVTANLCNSIYEVENEIQMQIAPNPFSISSSITINNLIADATIEITDLTGRILQTVSLAMGENQILFGNAFPSGIYFINLKRNGEIISTEKVIKSE